MIWRAVEQAIEDATGRPFKAGSPRTVGGGCINEAFVINNASGDERYFIKLNQPALLHMFVAEAAGLSEILASNSAKAPAPVCHGSDDSYSFLVLEYVAFSSGTAASAELLGTQLAAMHRHSAEQFGWTRDNTIGSTPQVNTRDNNWATFFGEHRLGFQLSLAKQNGAPVALVDTGQRLLQALPRFFETYKPPPSLLHGDLWGGNWATTTSGEPVIFDPAVYYGDREADLAMTELFGGFSDRFYQSYRHAWPWDAGYETRKVLYNLYHVLNHFNLFGASYAAQAQDMIQRLIAEVS